MPTTYTSLLGLALPATGELSGTWGTTVNDAITSLVDSSVAGTTTLSSDADVTLTTTSGVANQARQAIILWTANGSTTRNITAPATSKTYVVINASAGTQSIVIRGAGPTTGVTIIKGERAVVAWNGSDFVKISGFGGTLTVTDLTVTGNTILGDAAGDTITVNGATTFTNVNPTLSAGTANGVAYLNGSKVLTSGSALSFNGTNFGIGIATGAATLDVTGPANSLQARFGNIATRGLEISTTTVNGTNDAGSILNAQGAADGTLIIQLDSSEKARFTGSDFLLGGTSTGAAGIGLNNLLNYSVAEGSGASYLNLFRQTSSGATVLANGYKRSATASGFASSVGTSWAKTAIGLGVSTGDITFYADPAGTVANGTDVTPTERARITSTGNVVAGGSVALATNATDGFLYVPTCAGTPTGTPTAITGMAPIVVNTTNNKLYFYSGGAWCDAGP